MRIGFNPHRDQPQQQSGYLHQIIIPVYIPNQEGYFKDSFEILKLCLDSLFSTIHHKTFVTIVNNGSGEFVKDYLLELLKTNKIQELIHTTNIGKLNAIFKGLSGNNIELVTVSDADVMFLPNWQSETIKIFNELPQVGVVGLVPQIKTYTSKCGNLIFDNLFNKNFKFIPVKNKNAFIRFYESIGWGRDYNVDYLEYGLGIEINSDLKVYAGSGHFVATYKKDMFQEIVTFSSYKLGGNSEEYLDLAPLKRGYWRVTTYDNYAYHLGNTLEDWMKSKPLKNDNMELIHSDFKTYKKVSAINYFIKNRLFVKVVFTKWIFRLFLKWKKLPEQMIKNF
ncbi:glycosyltransferase family 2 protein [Flavobacterium sp. LB2P6]|uniref:glycosyltransferase family 2 protein n=1 Tax=Flavobacterium sp. LB2P6 TaxID=3401714 RepID=UPI003AAF9524